MEQRVSLITLGVTDLDRSVAFYEALGWTGKVIQETAFFQAGGLAVVLWGREKVADDSVVADTGADFSGIVLAHNVGSRDEVGAIVDAAERAGAVVTKAPQETFYGGWSAFFRDPDGHVWEIAHNPGFALGPDGELVLPDDFLP